MRCSSVSHHIHGTLKLEVRVVNRLPHNQLCRCHLDRDCDQPTSITTNVVDEWHRVFVHLCTVVDAHDRDGWTQTFGGKASEPRTFWPLEKQFYLPQLHLGLAPKWGWSHRVFRRDLLHHKTSLWAIVWRCLLAVNPTFSPIRRTPDLWQTDTRWEQIPR